MPEIIYDPSLLLSPHVFLLAILIRNRAFKNESLNDNPHLLSTLKIHPDSNELRLVLKDELKNEFLFRRTVRGIGGYVMSSQPISQDITGRWLKAIGKQLGFEHRTITYSLQYFAGNSLDQSSECKSLYIISHDVPDLDGSRWPAPPFVLHLPMSALHVSFMLRTFADLLKPILVLLCATWFSIMPPTRIRSRSIISTVMFVPTSGPFIRS